MTHSLHRRGSPGDLKDEVIFIFAPAKGINERGSASKARTFLEIMRKWGAVHYGDDLTGNVVMLGHEGLVAAARDLTNIHAVFADVDRAIGALREIVEADLGISVVVSGLFETVGRCCAEAGVRFHTIQHSMGFWGKTELLPPEPILEVVTMCGHGLVSVSLVKVLVEKIRKGVLTAEQAAEEMARLCLCGIFNPARAKIILERLASEPPVAKVEAGTQT